MIPKLIRKRLQFFLFSSRTIITIATLQCGARAHGILSQIFYEALFVLKFCLLVTIYKSVINLDINIV